MPVGLNISSHIAPVPGVKLSVAQAGVKYKNRNDVTVIEISEGAEVAAVFTKNRFCAAPVVVAKEHLQHATPRYLLINTGNANAGTGSDGLQRARESCKALAELADVNALQVLPFSTGVIGEPLPSEKIIAALPHALSGLKEDAWLAAAAGIMTTDTVPKAYSKTFSIEGEEIVISGIAKGAGMIKPNMATMLSYVATNAKVRKDVLQQMLIQVVDSSYNSITIDSDTSTNDACILIASGRSGVYIDDINSDAAQIFLKELKAIFILLAQSLIRDGEGATKFISIDVSQGKDLEDCREVAFTIAHSLLVKTALFASDPNWGRILACVGRANIESLDVNKVDIFLDDVCIVKNGERAASYTEAAGQKVMSQEDITIKVVLGQGDAQATVWTSDLSYDYVKINAEYRT